MMTVMPEITYQHLETLIAYCFAQSRILAVGLHVDASDGLEPAPLETAQTLIEKITTRDIFGEEFRELLAELEQALCEEVERGTEYVARYDSDPCNVSEQPSWQEARRSEAANGLTRVLVMLVELQSALDAVHDLLAAEATLRALRAAA